MFPYCTISDNTTVTGDADVDDNATSTQGPGGDGEGPDGEEGESSITSINSDSEFLLSCFPNPIATEATIGYNIETSSNVTLKIYNTYGQQINALVSEYQTSGYHEVSWQVEGLPTGTYFALIQTGDFTESIKISVR